ncbi:MAG: MFS transporter [Firmicutes bacterium]|nr:MFS transporter [Bacillota bacterium]
MPQLLTMIISIALGTLLNPLNSSMISVAQPTLITVFHTQLSAMSLMIGSYYIVSAIAQPAMGRLGDLFGHKRFFLLGVLLVAIASVAAPFSPNFWTLLVIRLIQAAGSATISPNGMALVRHKVRERQQGNAFGILATVTGAGAALGPTIGGLLLALGWQALFLINLPLCLIAGLLAWRTLEETPQQPNIIFDYRGTASLAAVLAGLMYLLDSLIGGHLSLVWVVVFALGSFCFAWFEQHTEEPLISFGLFRQRRFALVSIVTFLTNLAMYALLFSFPLYLELLRHFSHATTGLLMLSFSGVMSLISPLGGRLTDQHGAKPPLIIGAACSVLGMILLAMWTGLRTPLPWVIGAMIVSGVGVGIGGVAMQTAIIQAVPREMSGIASGLFMTVRYMGTIFSQTLLDGFLGRSVTLPGLRAMDLVLAVLLVVALVASLLIRQQKEAGERVSEA